MTAAQGHSADLLTPDEVRNALALPSRWGFGLALERRLARDYLTLWEENELWKDRTKELVEKLQMWEEHG